MLTKLKRTSGTHIVKHHHSRAEQRGIHRIKVVIGCLEQRQKSLSVSG